jgi:hypothetical protein
MRATVKSQLLRRRFSITTIVASITVVSLIFLFHKSSDGQSSVFSSTDLFAGPLKSARELISIRKQIRPTNVKIPAIQLNKDLNLLEDMDPVTRSSFVADTCTLGLNYV